INCYSCTWVLLQSDRTCVDSPTEAKQIPCPTGFDYCSVARAERFNKAPPRKATLLDWERRAFAFGSVKDRPRSGSKKTREETCAGVAASIEPSPIK
ncbi:hypothetical protein C0J52_27725, partial [Blattella germanica]